MIRLWPSSLLGQVLASVAAALLVAQVVAVLLIVRAADERRETALAASAAIQLVSGAERAALSEAFGPARRAAMRAGRGRGRAMPPPLRYTTAEAPPVLANQPGPEGAREARLREALLLEGVAPHQVVVATRRAGDDPALIAFAEDRPRFARRNAWRTRDLYVAAIQREPDARWEIVRLFEPNRPRSALGVLIFQTLIAFAFLFAALWFVLRRITRPLARLTERVSDFSREPGRVVLLEESGPSDTRRLIAAHNAMERRIAALLDEKDVMLGAIGHDLKTPLAALRVRIESVPDSAQRERMAASIEDITATLDDILSLSRVGRDGAGIEKADLGALAEATVEEFAVLGQPVTLCDPPGARKRIVAPVQVTWVKRALRNLISNAVRYGGTARVSLAAQDGSAVFTIEDDGPGIDPARIADMMEPFTRGEASRNRATGGAGLGLALARAIALQHGGTLVLTNRETGGLSAELRLPL
ncbi:ATP-binding protein [Qipengyuania nanhaisediminis]|uniref:ATP-binding protein n=1 Tax=Qipengyuania nanhaisediminis TaxID=604088 RepID=UPI0038B2ED92